MMKKKNILFAIMLIMCITLSNTCYAYLYDGVNYTIEVPDSYEENTEGSFSDEQGNGIDIQVNSFSGDALYTQEELDMLVESLEESLSYNSEEGLQALRESNEEAGNPLTEEELLEYADAMSYKVIEKEITKISDNEYIAFHLRLEPYSKENGVYMDQYMTSTDEAVITITYSSRTLEGLESQDVVNSLKSLTLVDGRVAVTHSGFAFEFVLFGIIAVLLILAVLFVTYKAIIEKINNKRKVNK